MPRQNSKTRVLDAIHGVTKASRRTIEDTIMAVSKDIHPLPGTIQHNIWTCLRMAEELGLIQDDETETD